MGDVVLDLGLSVLVGVAAGVVGGLWAIHVHTALEHEDTILLAVGTADVALLAVVLAAVALMATFLDDFFGEVIERAASIKAFFRPFWLVAIASGVGTIACFAGAIDANYGDEDSRAVLFGLAIGLSAWAIVGSIGLVSEFIRATIDKRRYTEKKIDKLSSDS